MQTPKAIVFDVNETLLSLSPLKRAVGRALGGREDLLPLWFSTLLHYSLVETLTGSYHDFGEIGTAALMMVAEAQGIALTPAEANAAVVPPLRSLPPHPDAAAGLAALRKDGRFKLVTLSNSSDAEAQAKLSKAGLAALFDAHYTVESLKKYKPHPDTYRRVLQALGAQPQEVLMVAAHAWDLMGAKNAGLRTAFVARAGKTLYPNAAQPDYVVDDLPALASFLR
ncbi:haloacid dehalogenase type II [Pontiella sp.]|uniref:haloacid dehalogenase type II n=1 Tax=Pontiella sp. TaxID=2837462 RepID=UPI00356666FC